MSAGLIVIERIQGQNPTQMLLAKDQDVIQAVASERPDQALNIWVLPGRSRGNRAVPNPHRPDSPYEGLPVSAVVVAHQIGRRGVPRERFHDLLRQPLRRRLPGHCIPEWLAPTVAYDHKRKQALECQGWNQT